MRTVLYSWEYRLVIVAGPQQTCRRASSRKVHRHRVPRRFIRSQYRYTLNSSQLQFHVRSFHGSVVPLSRLSPF